MIQRTYVIKADEETGYSISTDSCGIRLDNVTFMRPAKVFCVDHDIHESRFTNEDLWNKEEVDQLIRDAKKEGRKEAWELAHDLMTSPDFGADFVTFGGWDSPIDIFKDTHEHVYDVAQKWRGRPKRFDIVKVHVYDGEEEAIITRVDGNEVDLMCRGGKTTRRYIDTVIKTGKTLEYGLLKWVKGE